MITGRGFYRLAYALGGGALLLAPGCRGFIPEKTETTPIRRVSTRVEQTLPKLQRADASLEREVLRVHLAQEQPCILEHQDEVRTTTTSRQEPVQRSTVLLSIAGTALGGLLGLPSLETFRRCSTHDLDSLCRAIHLPPTVVGLGILIPSVGVLASQLPRPARVHVSASTVRSEERAVCSREPVKSVVVELAFPSGERFKALTDDGGDASFRVSEVLAAELRSSGGRVVLRVDNAPLRGLDFSHRLDLLPASPGPVPPPQSPGRDRGPPGSGLW